MRARFMAWLHRKLRVVPLAVWEETEHLRYLASLGRKEALESLTRVQELRALENAAHNDARRAYVEKLTELTRGANPSGVFVLPVGGKLQTAAEFNRGRARKPEKRKSAP